MGQNDFKTESSLSLTQGSLPLGLIRSTLPAVLWDPHY